MEFIKNFFERTEPLVQKGAKYSWLGSVHEGFFTFLYVSKDTSKSGTHIHDFTDLKRTMSIVVLALVPAILFGMYNTGLQHFRAIGEVISIMEGAPESGFSDDVAPGHRVDWGPGRLCGKSRRPPSPPDCQVRSR